MLQEAPASIVQLSGRLESSQELVQNETVLAEVLIESGLELEGPDLLAELPELTGLCQLSLEVEQALISGLIKAGLDGLDVSEIGCGMSGTYSAGT